MNPRKTANGPEKCEKTPKTITPNTSKNLLKSRNSTIQLYPQCTLSDQN